MENVIDIRLLDSIRRSPGRVLKHHTMKLGVNPVQGLESVNRLIEAGHVHRHSFSDKLRIADDVAPQGKEPEIVEPVQPKRPGAFSARVGIPDPDSATSKPAAEVATQEEAQSASDALLEQVPTISSAPLPRRLALSELHCRILGALYAGAGALTTPAIASACDIAATGIGPALNTLRHHDLIDRISEPGSMPKMWQLTDAGRSLAKTPGIVGEIHTNKPAEPISTDAATSVEAIATPAPADEATPLQYMPLTPEQIDEFANMPLGFTVMLNEVHRAGFNAASELSQARSAHNLELDRLMALINTPEINAFLRAVHIEAVHQIERWGVASDRGKRAADWFWLVGFLAGKALHAATDGDHEKALHHCISTSAALYNWHCAIKAVDVRTCPESSDVAERIEQIFPGETLEA
jgi:hypothetical protein